MSDHPPRTHVVTGAGSGIGEVLASRLAERGDRLVLLARSAGRAEELRGRFTDARVLVVDLADPGMLNGLGREIDGPVDSVVHVAGVVELAEIAKVRLHELEQQLAVNLVAPALLTRELLPQLRASRGTVVFVNSTSGLSASAKWGAYAASKFGLRAVADVLREEEKAHGVRVTSVFPSRTATPMQERVHEQEGKDYDPSQWIQPATVAEMVLHVLDLPEDATVPEVVVRPR